MSNIYIYSSRPNLTWSVRGRDDARTIFGSLKTILNKERRTSNLSKISSSRIHTLIAILQCTDEHGSVQIYALMHRLDNMNRSDTIMNFK